MITEIFYLVGSDFKWATQINVGEDTAVWSYNNEKDGSWFGCKNGVEKYGFDTFDTAYQWVMS